MVELQSKAEIVLCLMFRHMESVRNGFSLTYSKSEMPVPKTTSSSSKKHREKIFAWSTKHISELSFNKSSPQPSRPRSRWSVAMLSLPSLGRWEICQIILKKKWTKYRLSNIQISIFKFTIIKYYQAWEGEKKNNILHLTNILSISTVK